MLEAVEVHEIVIIMVPGFRRLSRWRVGQNLYQSYNSRPTYTNWKAAMDSWFWSEISLFPVSSVYRFNPFLEATFRL